MARIRVRVRVRLRLRFLPRLRLRVGARVDLARSHGEDLDGLATHEEARLVRVRVRVRI